MRLIHLLQDLPDVMGSDGRLDVKITNIVSDSRQATPGALFVAYRGVGVDGHRFIPDALTRGAVAVVGERPWVDLPSAAMRSLADAAAPYVQVVNGRAALAWLNAAWHGHPSRDMAMVGITGTDGKTTTANALFSILRAAGLQAGLISTVNAVIGEQVFDTGLHTTTPDAPDVQRYLAQMRAAGTQIAVLETTSHGLAQHRLTGCAFDVAVVTNITHEHLDYHGSYEAYRDAKAMLFRSLQSSKPHFGRKPSPWANLPKTAVLNRDDTSYDFFSAIPVERTITYGLTKEHRPMARNALQAARDRSSDAPSLSLTATEIRHGPAGVELDVEIVPISSSFDHRVRPLSCHFVTSLVGRYNVYNILAAAAAALALGIELPAIREGVAGLRAIPGRMERIDRGQPFTALVDFAHTPNALARTLETARALGGSAGRVIVVFGSAGLRDREKRRLMGQVAARLADLTIITAEDPRTEDLDAIMAEIAAAFEGLGVAEGEGFLRIPDRQRAVLRAVTVAAPGDVVLVCGKGHEQSMCFGTIEHPWRDQDAVAWALDLLRGAADEQPPFVLPTWT